MVGMSRRRRACPSLRNGKRPVLSRFAALMLAILACAIPSVAWSHAVLLGTEPAEGVVVPGRPADLALLLAPLGSAHDNPLTCIEQGDIPGIAAMVIDGEVQYEPERDGKWF